jgi:poly(A) polymerase
MAEAIARRLRFSLREKDFVKHLIYLHLRPGYLADIKRPSPRAVYRYFRDTGEEAVGILLLSLSDWRATRGPLTDFKRRGKHEKIMLFLIGDYFRKQKSPPLKRLVTGYDIMKKIKVPPSPVVGVILKNIQEMQALGRISTKKEALKLALQVYCKYR